MQNFGDREMIHDDEVIQDTEDSEPNSEHESTDASVMVNLETIRSY